MRHETGFLKYISCNMELLEIFLNEASVGEFFFSLEPMNATILDKDSIELKVLVLINSNVKPAFDCGEDKKRSESRMQLCLKHVGQTLSYQIYF